MSSSMVIHGVEAELVWFDLIRSLKPHERAWLYVGEREMNLHDNFVDGLVSREEVEQEIRQRANAL